MDRKSEPVVNPYSQVFLCFNFGKGVDGPILDGHCLIVERPRIPNSQNLALLLVEF